MEYRYSVLAAVTVVSAQNDAERQRTVEMLNE